MCAGLAYLGDFTFLQVACGYLLGRIVVGHTTRDEIVSLYSGRVIGIDAALKDGAPGELLVWDNNRLWRGLADGSRKLLAPGDDDGTANGIVVDPGGIVKLTRDGVKVAAHEPHDVRRDE